MTKPVLPNAKKYGGFFQFQTKNPNLTKKNVFFFWFSIFKSYNSNTEHIVTNYNFTE